MTKKINALISFFLVILLSLSIFYPKTISALDNNIIEKTKKFTVDTYHFSPKDDSDKSFYDGPYGDTSGYIPLWRFSKEYAESTNSTANLLEYYCYRTEKGNVTYCLQLGRPSPKGIEMSYSEKRLTEELNRVIKMGYPSKSGSDYGVSDIELEWATAVALKITEGNAYTASGGITKGLTLDDFKTTGKLDMTFIRKYYPPSQLSDADIIKYTQKANNIYNAIEKLVNYGKDSTIINNTISINDASDVTIYNDMINYKVGPFNAKISSPESSDCYIKITGASDDYKIVDVNGNAINKVNWNQDFYIAGTTKVNLDIKVEAFAPDIIEPTPICYENTTDKGIVSDGDGNKYELPYQKMYVYEPITLVAQTEAKVKLVNGKITITKDWIDSNNEYNTRPEQIIFNLYQDGIFYKKISMSNTNQDTNNQNLWKGSVSVPAYKQDGTKHTYTLDEEPINLANGDYYESSKISGSHISNILKGEIELNIKKIWKDNLNSEKLRPDKISIIIQQNGIYYKEFIIKGNSDSESWEGKISLPKYDETGKLYKYDFYENEINLPNGDKYIPSNKDSIIINTLTGESNLKLTKIWDDHENEYNTRPLKIKINVYQNNNYLNYYYLSRDNQIDNNTWQTSIKVPKYDEEGQLYKYTIEEDENNPNLQMFYKEPLYNQTSLTVTNIGTWVPEVKDDIKYDITVNKNILNDDNSVAAKEDFDKIKLNIDNIYNFNIILKQLNRTVINTGTELKETYQGYSGKIYNGIVTNKNNLVFSNIEPGKYEILENNVQYFKFLNFKQKISSSENAKLSYTNGKYYIEISGLTAKDENINIDVNNKINITRPYDDKDDKINKFKAID